MGEPVICKPVDSGPGDDLDCCSECGGALVDGGCPKCGVSV